MPVVFRRNGGKLGIEMRYGRTSLLDPSWRRWRSLYLGANSIAPPVRQSFFVVAVFCFWPPLFTIYETVGKRNKIAQEILATEQTYVNSLKVVVQLFLEPLRDPANKQIITTEDLRSIFSEIEVILGYNGKLLGEIEQRMEAWSFDSCLGDIFSKMVSV